MDKLNRIIHIKAIIHVWNLISICAQIRFSPPNCRAGSEATNRAAMSFLYVYIYVAVTGRKRTLFHCMWANLISYIFIEITPDFLCPFMND